MMIGTAHFVAESLSSLPLRTEINNSSFSALSSCVYSKKVSFIPQRSEQAQKECKGWSWGKGGGKSKGERIEYRRKFRLSRNGTKKHTCSPNKTTSTWTFSFFSRLASRSKSLLSTATGLAMNTTILVRWCLFWRCLRASWREREKDKNHQEKSVYTYFGSR